MPDGSIITCSDTAKRCLNNLVNQDLLRVLFFNGDPKPVRGFSLKNKLQAGFGLYLQTLNNKAPWSMEDFEFAKNITLGQFPTLNSSMGGFKRKIAAIRTQVPKKGINSETLPQS